MSHTISVLPFHPVTGLQAVGFWRGDRPIWPILGGSGDDGAPDGDGNSPEDGTDGDTPPDELGDAGKRAIAAEREKARSARRDLKAFTDLGVTPQQLRDLLEKSKPKDDVPDADQIRREASLEATAKANTRILRAEVKVLAAESFADPADAPLYLDLSKYEVDERGEVDQDEIKADLAAVLKAKPHLSRRPNRPKPDEGQGPRPDTSKPSVSAGRDLYAQMHPQK